MRQWFAFMTAEQWRARDDQREVAKKSEDGK
jgi:site-specific recombinase XerD